jgi:hypothetical protein
MVQSFRDYWKHTKKSTAERRQRNSAHHTGGFFLKRNQHLIRAKKPLRFETKRAEWCTYQNMLEMYNKVYSHLVEVGLAVRHPEPVLRYGNGDVVVGEQLAFGKKSHFELIHPDWVVFVDEVGNNTSQTKDGQVGGQKFLCAKDGRPQQRLATKDAHFTMLGFTSASGEPLLCAIIFAAKELKNEWVLGFDPFAAWIGEENEIEQNIGEGKSFPMGPVCNFNGKTSPCCCCCSESGSITGKLLTEMLAAIDKLEVFDGSTGLNPFLLAFEINKTDVVGLVKSVWGSSFAHTKCNQKATMHRGWGPKALNYNVICHPEIASSKNGSTQASLPSSYVFVEELNLSQGLSGALVDRIVVQKNRESSDGDDALEWMRKRKATAEEQIKSQNKRMTAGLLTSSGHFHLSVDVHDYVQEKANAEQED